MTLLEATRTTETLTAVGAALLAASADLGLPISRDSVLILLAQYALETGRGKSCYNYNLGNVKAPNADVDHTYYRCNEIVSLKAAADMIARSRPRQDGGGLDAAVDEAASAKRTDGKVVIYFWPEHPACRFRAWRTLFEGARYYYDFLRTRYASAWKYVLAGDAVGFVACLKASNYFTADELPYRTAVVSLVREFSRIDFDTVAVDDPIDYDEVDRIIDAAMVQNIVYQTLRQSTWDAINDSFRAHGRDDDA